MFIYYTYNLKLSLFQAFLLSILFILFSCSGPIKQVKQPKVKKEIQYLNEIEALQNFDFEVLNEEKLNNFEQKLYQSLKFISQLNFFDAEKLLWSTLYELKDSSKKFLVKKILVDLLFYNNDWKGILSLDNIQAQTLSTDNSLVLVHSYSEVENEQVNYSSDSVEIDYEKSHSGTPIIEILINGSKRYFWFDTGANYTVIASDIAKEINIKPIKNRTAKALTATSLQINVLPAVIKELKIGNVEISNHPVIIAEESDLRFKLFGSNRITKVDGIIGWKAIQKMDVTFDDRVNKATFRKPFKDSLVDRNLHWLGIPFVTLFTEDSVKLIFGLDTGSEKSSITSNIFKKVSYDEIYSITKKISSAGGWTFSESKNISKLNLKIDNHNIEFFDIGTIFTHQNLFVKIDGIIGSDLFRQKKVRIDILNGRLSIDN